MRALALAAVFALGFVLYLPTTRYGFTGWDDTAYVVDNPNVVSTSGLARIWTSPDSDVYYPLMYTSYWLEYRCWGPAPAGYHATNAFLHGLDAALLVVLLGALGADLGAAAIGGALFAAHPLQVMTVAWIAERKNLLALLFMLVTLLLWTRADDGSRGRTPRLLALAAFAAALASKTAVLGLSVGLLLYETLVKRRRASVSLARTAPMMALSVAAAWVTVVFERPFVGREPSVLVPAFAERLQIAGAAPWFYLGKLVWPFGLSPAYPRWPVDAGRLLWWLPLSASLAAVLAFVIVLRRLVGERARCAVWLLGVGALLLLPSSGLVAFANLAVTFASDHLFYLSSAAVFAAAALALPRGRARAIAVPLTAAYVIATLAYQPVFRDATSLWSRVLERDPESYAANLGLAEARVASGSFAAALPLYERAIRIEPREADAYLLLARAEQERGDVVRASELFARALELQPSDVTALVGLARISERSGRTDEALALYQRAVRAAPRDVPARMGLAALHLAYGRPDAALVEFRAAIDIAPATARAYLGAATSLRSLSREAEAVATLRAGLASAPGDVPLTNFLALILATAADDRVRDGRAAVALAQHAVAAAKPGGYELEATLAAAYAEAGRFEDALRESRGAEAGAADAHDEGSLVEQRRRSALYARGEPLRLTPVTR